MSLSIPAMSTHPMTVGLTFHPALFPGGTIVQGRQSLAIGPVVASPQGPSPSVGGVVYAMIGASDGLEYAGMFASFDAGGTWNPGTVLSPTIPSFTASGTTIDGSNPNNFSQSFYDQAMVVSPSDPSTLFFGGVGLYKSSGQLWTFMGLPRSQRRSTFRPARDGLGYGSRTALEPHPGWRRRRPLSI